MADVTKEDDLKRTVNECIKEFGKVDILVNLSHFYMKVKAYFAADIFQVNNVGFTRGSATIETMKLSDYDQVMNVNVRSIIQLTQLCLPHLIKQKGIVYFNLIL